MRRTDSSSSRPPDRIFLLVDVSSKARVSVSVAKLFVKRFLAPRCDVFSVDDDSDGNEVNDERGRRVRRRMKTKKTKKERMLSTTCTETKFCARFYDASKTPSQMDGFVRRAIVQLQREDEEDKEEEEETNTTTSSVLAYAQLGLGSG